MRHSGVDICKIWNGERSQTVGENLVRYVPTGTYFARLRVQGKLIIRSLKTKSLWTLGIVSGSFRKFPKHSRKSVEAFSLSSSTVECNSPASSFRLLPCREALAKCTDA